MRYFLVITVLFLASCSLNSNSVYWNEDPSKRKIELKKISKISKMSNDLKKMTYDELNIFLKEYYKKTDYPDIND